MTPKQRNAYYLRKYGISLERYNEMLEERDGGCHICGWKPQAGQRALAVEHDHKVARGKISAKYSDGSESMSGWFVEFPDGYAILEEKKRMALRKARRYMKEISVRGLVCWGCNSLLKKGRDNPDILNNAANYLLAYRNKLRGDRK